MESGMLCFLFTKSPISSFVFISCILQVDERALRDIMEMGFNKEAARQALMDHSNNLEAALNFLLNSNKPKPAQGPLPRGTINTRH